MNGSASLIEPHGNLEAGLTAAARAARAPTSALWEFNYGASRRATLPEPHTLAAPNKPLMNMKRRRRSSVVLSSVMDPAPGITANTASFTLHLSNKVLYYVKFHLLLLRRREPVSFLLCGVYVFTSLL